MFYQRYVTSLIAIFLSTATGCGKKSSNSPAEHGRWVPIEQDEDGPSPRMDHIALWVEEKLMIWGGEGRTSLGLAEYYKEGYYFDLEERSWSDLLEDDQTPSARSKHQGVLADNSFIIWGGQSQGSISRNDGAVYDLLAQNWTRITRTNAPTGTVNNTLLWADGKLLAWGGASGIDTGGAYRIETDQWSNISSVNAPHARTRHSSIWSGEELIIWGGFASGSRFNDGAAYDPLTESWQRLPASDLIEPRSDHSAIWTGVEMIVWGGLGDGTFFNDGLRYNPLTQEWMLISNHAAPSHRAYHTAVWSGTHMIVWGGEGMQGALATGGIYDPETDSWLPTAFGGAPRARFSHTAVWTGDKMIIWGGWRGPFVADGSPSVLGDGGIFSFP